MKPNLFPLLCLTGLVPAAVSVLKSVPHHYDLTNTQMTWSAAVNYCRNTYTDLAKVLSDTDMLRLKKVAASKGLATPAWIGLYDDVTGWRWSLNNLQSLPYTNWYPGLPDNHGGNEACVALGSDYTWWDEACTQLRPFVCYSAVGPSKYIGVSSLLVIWSDAQAYCRTHYTDLPSSFSSADNDAIGQVAPFGSWIGLYRKMWKWADGTLASNLPWVPAEPDNSGGHDNCAVVLNGLYNDVPCTNLYYAFCHTISPKRSQILRLQVKSDGSVFDPAVQSSILSQMKQKLEANGMWENTTMTWKVQPDGNIFHKKKKD